jgi:hypothetical protein
LLFHLKMILTPLHIPLAAPCQPPAAIRTM